MKFPGFPKKQTAEFTADYEKLNQQSAAAAQFIVELQQGDLNAALPEILEESALGTALRSMRDHLNKIAKEEQQRNWLNAGLAHFSDILRNKESLEFQELTDQILSNLVRYVNANQGALFTLEHADGEAYLEMISCYAYDKKKHLHKRFELGTGLAGQCALERQTIYLRQVPHNYVNITSGLGEATPRSMLIAPLLINERVFGVLELASFEEVTPNQINFINKLAENIAAAIKNVKDNATTLAMLQASKQQAEELRSQEEEMRQNME